MPRESEEWFDVYVRANGHDPGEPEPDLGVPKRPDRLISWAGHQAVCEIKEFDTSALDRRLSAAGERLGPVMVSSSEDLGPVRRAVKSAAAQLRPLQESGYPLVVVIANPGSYHVNLDARQVIYALYGDPEIRFEVNTETGASEGPIRTGAGGGGRLRWLRRDGSEELFHEYISAVAILRRRCRELEWGNRISDQLKEEFGCATTEEEAIRRVEEIARRRSLAIEAGNYPTGFYHRMDVIVTASTEAVPLPVTVFDGKTDQRWEYVTDSGDPLLAMFERVR